MLVNVSKCKVDRHHSERFKILANPSRTLPNITVLPCIFTAISS